ncbi:MAG: hypothetical protein ABI304_00435 [Rudaea sp.]
MQSKMGSRFKLTAALCFASLAVLMISVALAIGVFQFRASVDLLARNQLDNAQTAQKYLFAQRQSDLLRASASMASNPAFIGYMAQALSPSALTGAIDIASIRDLLEERRGEHHLDIAAIVSPAGRVIAASGDASLDDSNLGADPVLQEARKALNSASGIHRDAQGIELIAFTPVLRGGNLEAWLLTGNGLNAAYIKNLTSVANVDAALVVANPSTAATVLASNLGADITAQLPVALASTALPDSDKQTGKTQLNLGNAPRIARITPLPGSHENVFLVLLQPMAAVNTMRSAIAVPLAIGIAALLILGSMFALLFWLRCVRPLAALSRLCDYSLNGDYALTASPSAGRTLAHVNRAFNHLLGLVDTYRPKPGIPNRRSADRK